MSNNNGKPEVAPQPQGLSDFVKPGESFVVMKYNPVSKEANILTSPDFQNPLAMFIFVLNTLSAAVNAVMQAATQEQSRIVKPTMLFR